MANGAVLAGGCFWGMQDLIRKLPGVLETRVCYTGGDVPHATYRNHGTHAEAIEILFDPDRISYRRILEFFFQIHDPTTKDRQGNDAGASYRSAIYYVDDEQKRIAGGHDRGRRGVRPVGRQDSDGGRAGRRLLGGGARAPRLLLAPAERLHLSLPPARLGSAEA